MSNESVENQNDAACGQSGSTVMLGRVLAVIESEPEYPDPCPKIREWIRQAARLDDEGMMLEIVRLAVGQTKRSICERIKSMPNVEIMGEPGFMGESR